MVRASRVRFEMWYIRAIQGQCVLPNVDPLYLHVTLIPSDKGLEMGGLLAGGCSLQFGRQATYSFHTITKTHHDAVYVFDFKLAHQWRLAF